MSLWTDAVARLPTQPVLWWRMNAASIGTTKGQANSGSTGATDAGTIGDGTGLFSGTIGATSLLIGDADKAITFTGASSNTHDSVNCAADATNLQPATTLTIACIIKPTTLDNVNGNMLCCYADSGGRFAYAIYINPTTPVPHFFFNGTGTVTRNLAAAGTVATGITYFLVATYDGTTMKIYINGAQDPNTTAISTSVLYTSLVTPRFSFGGWDVGQVASASNFNGVMDETMFFKVALTQAQVSMLYNASLSEFPYQPNYQCAPILAQ